MRAAGRAVTDRYKSHLLRGYNVRGERATGAKHVRASVVAAAAENGLIKISGRNTNEFLDELTAFPHAPHDDCVDALSGAHQALSHGGHRMHSYVARGNIYEFAEGALRGRTRPSRSRLQVAQHQHLEDERAAQLAAAIGTTLYDPKAMRL